MSWTKRQFIERAFSEIGFGKRSYTITVEDFEDALAVFDSMALNWQARFGFGIGWPISDNPDDSNIDEETSVPLPLTQCVWANGAKAIASSFGKQVMPETNTLAKDSWENMVTFFEKLKGKPLPKGIPYGAGNRMWGRSRIFSPTPQPVDSHDNIIERL